MNIKLKNIAPHPLIGAFSPSTDIWGKAITIEKESKVLILAPSGSGKTTLVSVLYGLRKDFDGELFFNDESTSVFDIDKWSDIRSNSIAVVFQDLQLLADLTAMENILLKNQLTNQFSRAKIEEMANQLGILNKLNSKCNNLSRGEKQRVAIIRALCMPFKFIILDEPFSHLDEINTQKAIALINKIVASNKAGLIMVNLFADNHFNYVSQIKMV
jgi:ABC-type lipoprotein export system ATPase subunit